MDDAVSVDGEGRSALAPTGSPWWRQLYVPDGVVSWPPHCVNCGAPADRVVEIQSEDSRVAPLSGVPYCIACFTRREELLKLKGRLRWRVALVTAACSVFQAIVLGLWRGGMISQRVSDISGVAVFLVVVGSAVWAVWHYRIALRRARIGDHVALGFPIRVLRPPGGRNSPRILLVKRDSVADWLLRNPEVTEGKRFFYVRAIA